MHDVFFWLICQGNEEMVRHMWARCALPVHVALLGSAIAKKMVAVLVEPGKTAWSKVRSLAVPQLGAYGSSGYTWWPRAARQSQGRPRPLSAQPLSRGLKRAASIVAHFTAF